MRQILPRDRVTIVKLGPFRVAITSELTYVFDAQSRRARGLLQAITDRIVSRSQLSEEDAALPFELRVLEEVLEQLVRALARKWRHASRVDGVCGCSVRR